MTSFIDPFCISAYVVCSHEYLLIRRASSYLHGTWQMVTGGVHEGEKAYEAAYREIQEETGLIPDRLYSADAVETFYMQKLDKITSVPVFVAILDQKRLVKLSPLEHSAFEWLSFEEARDRLLFAEQRRVITHVHHEFVLKTPDPFFLIEQSPQEIDAIR